MDEYAKLRALLDLAEGLGIAIRPAPAGHDADHPGGALVTVRGRQMLFLDSDGSVADRIAVVAEALRGRAELETMYLPPEVRQLIDGD